MIKRHPPNKNYVRRLIAAVAPAAARSCFALTLLPAARGKPLAPCASPVVPALVRLVGIEPIGPVVPEVFRTPPETSL